MFNEYGLKSIIYERKKIIFEEWRNVISKDNKDNLLLSLHKKYSEDKYETQLIHNYCRYLLEIMLNDSPTINNVKYVEYKGPITICYSSSSMENENELITNLLYENKDENNTEEVKEKILFTKNERSGKDGYNVQINEVETQSVKKKKIMIILKKIMKYII